MSEQVVVLFVGGYGRSGSTLLERMLGQISAFSLSVSFHGQMLTLAANHTVSGNPMRLRTGEIEVSLDEEWRTKMKGAHKRIVTALTWPLFGQRYISDLKHGDLDVPQAR